MFDERYYKTGNYENYLQRKFESLCSDLIDELSINKSSKILDFGCGYGGLIREFVVRGYKNIIGTDISIWIIKYGKEKYPEIDAKLHYYNLCLLEEQYSYIIFLDVLEHIEEYLLCDILDLLRNNNKNSTFVARIPISDKEGGAFFLDVSNNDKTHINCHCREWWIDFLSSHGVSFVKDLQKKSIYSSEGVLSGIWKIK